MKRIGVLILLLIIGIFTLNFASAAEKTNFTIKNIQNSSEEIEYTYDIHVDGLKGAVHIKNGDKEDYVVFDIDGNSSIKVQSNNDLVILDIPKGSNYTLTVQEVDNYEIKIENLNFTTYKGIVGNNSSISVNSYSKGGYSSSVIITKDKTKDEKKKNPSTSDHIALLGLAALFAILLLYTLVHKGFAKYEDS